MSKIDGTNYWYWRYLKEKELHDKAVIRVIELEDIIKASELQTNL